MLLEGFLNRYRRSNFNAIVFPSVVVPITMLFGLFLLLPFQIINIVLIENKVNADIFNYKFAYILGMTGLSLIWGGYVFGALWGLIKEKRGGYKRSNFEPLLLTYLFGLGLSFPYPCLVAYNFISHYPFVSYPAYEMELKPTPELEAEIEHFGLAEIKWHTPFNSALERQVVRYEFLESEDSRKVEDLKFSTFLSVIQGRSAFKYLDFKPTYDSEKFGQKVNRKHHYYPEVMDVNGKKVCLVTIRFKEPIAEGVLVPSDGVRLEPVVRLSDFAVAYDFSNAFIPITNARSEICSLNRDQIALSGKKFLDFWGAQLMLPNTYQHVFEFRRVDDHHILDFSFANFVKALGRLS